MARSAVIAPACPDRSDHAGLDALDLPNAWRDAIDRILSGGARRVLVLGSRDVGKSSFCRLAMRAAAEAGSPAALLDTDLGQKTIGPPACLTLGRESGPEPALADLAFVGTTDPVAGLCRLVAGAERLLAQAGPDLTFINTSGLLGGPGFALKGAKIRALEPDLLVGLGPDPDLLRLLERHAEIPSVLLPKSPLARRKTRGQRRAARRRAFAGYFDGAVIRPLRIDQSAVAGRLPPAGLLVGLVASGATEVGIGILEGASAEASANAATLAVRMPAIAVPIRWLVSGAMTLDSEFNDYKLAVPIPERLDASD